MKIMKLDLMPKRYFKHPMFTAGPKAHKVIASKGTGSDIRVSEVFFGKGVRTKFHTHSTAQVLIVTGGQGAVATEKGETAVREGDVIYIPAGEKHWHGATPNSRFSHISIQSALGKMTKLED